MRLHCERTAIDALRKTCDFNGSAAIIHDYVPRIRTVSG